MHNTSKPAGISGPVQFTFKTGQVERRAIAFWCAMMPRVLFDKIGLLDEIFSPGMGEDGDFSIKAELAGYSLVQVPTNISPEFGTGIPVQDFPICHKGSATFGFIEDGGLIARNKKILDDRYSNQPLPTESKNMTNPKYSIVIPSFNHLEDLLIPCINSIIEYTDLDQIEVIVVANGCKDGTKAYLEQMGKDHPTWFKAIWIEEPAGYTRSTNEGIKISTGEYVVLLNNDTVLLPQPKNCWLQLLEAPFAKKEVGLTGPLELFDLYSNGPVLIFFCVMIKREVLDTIGLLDETFSPGGGEDIDFTFRSREAGYEAVCVNETVYNGVTNVGHFPIWHVNNQTFREDDRYTRWIVKRNGVINCKRYNKDIRLNLGSAGVDVPGFLSVDMYDKRSHVLMDCTNLKVHGIGDEKTEGFDDNSVTEILASHLFEHINPYKSTDTLREWLRVLKPGGRLVMEMPDILELCRRFADPNTSTGARYGILNAVYGSVNTTNVGEPCDITAPHLFGWYPQSLGDHLYNAGYVNIVFGPEQIPHPESNFRSEATKPLPERYRLKVEEPYLYGEIFEQNVYGVEVNEMRDQVVLDLGANVGYFTLYAIEHGAKKVISVEAQPTVFTGLLANTRPYSEKVLTINRAVYSSDNDPVYIENQHVGSYVNTKEKGDLVSTISLATLCSLHPDVSILKMDIEGSEYDSLLTTDNAILQKFKIIYLELHGSCNPNPQYREKLIIEDKLTQSGFRRVRDLQMTGGVGMTEPMGVYTQKWVKG